MRRLKSFGVQGDTELRITLGALGEDLAGALQAEFGDVDAVEVVVGDLLRVRCDAIVSPANSFGDMGGGIDKAIDDATGGAAQRAVRSAIAERFLGELPVGAALVVDVSARRHWFVVAAPTMRVPGNVAGSVNAYLAMRAALVAVVMHNASDEHTIRHLAVPGMGTGVGGIPHADAAHQMRVAYDNVIGGGWRKVVHAAVAPFAMR